MVYLYLCKACEDGRHSDCELGHPAPPGVYGGSKCRCQCSGDPLWDSPKHITENIQKIVDTIVDNIKANFVVGRPKDVTKTISPERPEDGKD